LGSNVPTSFTEQSLDLDVGSRSWRNELGHSGRHFVFF
jgi:hypothetical protein